MIEVRQATQDNFDGYRKGTLLQANKEVDGKRNIYIVLRDVKRGEDIRALRLVSNKGERSDAYLETCDYVSFNFVELFKGELVIKNV